MWTASCNGCAHRSIQAGLFATKSDDGFNTVMRIASFVRQGGTLGMLADLAGLEGRSGSLFRAYDVGDHRACLACPPRRVLASGLAG